MEMTAEETIKQLGEAIADVLTVEPLSLTDSELTDALVNVMRAGSALDAATARLAGEADSRQVWADDGSKSCSAWMGRAARRPVGECRAVVRRARRLRSMPITDQRHAEGDIATAHVQRLIGAAKVNADAFSRDEQMLVDFACTLRFDDFCRAIDYWCQLNDPDGCEDAARDRYESRRIHLSQTIDGMAVIDGVFDPVGFTEFSAALERIEHELWLADWSDARERCGAAATEADLARTSAQRRYDALIEMARRATAVPAGARKPRPLITALVDLPTLTGRVCELSTGTVVTPGEILPLLRDADIERVVFDGPSRVLDVGATQRLFTGATRRAIEVRDRRCTHPTCNVPVHRCDVDHRQRFEHGGPTTQVNGELTCPPHNPGRQRRRPPNPDDDEDHRR